MKIAAAAADRFVAAPDPKVRAVLVFGPDEGLVAERGAALARSVVPDLSDAFRVVEIAGTQLKDDPARLADEIAAISLMGGRRVIRVRPAGEESVTALSNALEAPAGDALIVLEAGDLKKASKLRKLAEDASNAAAIACYADDGRSLDALVEETLAGFGLRAAPEALSWLVENLGSDRGVSRRELEKLALYKGPRPGQRPDAGAESTVGLEDALAIVGDSSALSLDDVALAAADGDQKGLDRALDRVLAEGAAAVSILRAVGRHLQRLHQALSHMAAGANAREAVARLRPMPPFTVTPRYQRQLGLWTAAHIGEALALLTEAELQCKTTGMPDITIARRACMRIANAANIAARSRTARR